MALRLHLSLLLWKNYTLKKRSVFVLMLEILIPLVLFFVLVLLRWRQPVTRQPTSYYRAWPLPSAGLISLLEAFCPNAGVDEYGFPRFTNSSTYQFLSDLNLAAKRYKFFKPDFAPSDLSDMVDVYRSVIEDPIGWKHRFAELRDFPLRDVMNTSERDNSSIIMSGFCGSNDSMWDLQDAVLNMKALYRILYENGPVRVVPSSDGQKYAEISTNISSKDVQFYLSDPCASLLMQSDLRDALRQFQSSMDGVRFTNTIPNSIRLPYDQLSGPFRLTTDWYDIDEAIYSPDSVMCLMELAEQSESDDRVKATIARAALRFLLDPNIVHDGTFLNDAILDAVITPGFLRRSACDGLWKRVLYFPDGDRNARIGKIERCVCNMSANDLENFSSDLRRRINDSALVSKLGFSDMNLTTEAMDMVRFVRNLEKYNVFRSTLKDFAAVAAFLPQDECSKKFGPSTTTSSTSTDSHNSSSDHGHHLPNRGLLKLWKAMQRVVCGPNTEHGEKAVHAKDASNEEFSSEALGLSSSQEQNLKVLLRLFMSNPKLLYAPANTTADEIIRKANSTFALIDTITDYAGVILNISESLEAYLALNSTQKDLLELRELHLELSPKRAYIHQLRIKALDDFLTWDPVPDSQELSTQLTSTRNAACSWVELMLPLNLDIFMGFANEKDLVHYFLSEAYWNNVTVFGSVIFNMNPDGSLPNHMVYTIRQNASFTTTTLAVRSLFWSPGPRSWDYSYYNYGFMWIQDIIERAMIDLYAEREIVYPGSYIQQFPYPCYIWNNFLFMIKHILPMMLATSWVYWVAMLVQAIVYEKQQRLKEVMKTMGLSNGVHWLSWFITSYTQVTLTMSLLTLVLKYGDVLTYSNAWIIFLILEIFGAATIMFAFLISTFYSKAKIAAAWAGIIYFLSYVPFLYISIREEAAHVTIPGWMKALASLSSTTAFGLGAKYFAHYEMAGVGCQWKDIPYSPLEGDTFTLLHVIVMMVADVILYGLIAFYVENVFPGQYGVPKPWYFPIMYSYWNPKIAYERDYARELCSFACKRCQRRRNSTDQAISGIVPMNDIGSNDGLRGRLMCVDDFEVPICEEEPTHLTMGVKIDNLCKRYRKADQFAVDHLSLNFYEGQITAFLGHNGAGKTTTMSMLTGLLPPSSGAAEIYGRDIIHEMDHIRQSLGTCPQYNVLFDKLTVEEHLWFYARLKGVTDADVKAETEKLIWDLGLPDKRHSVVDALSGGMKRKLSVAIAFAGGSRTVILDEPTAGVDPYARRAIWDLIIRYKPGRTILLSTHHMDEADVVGDRIAIVAQGRLRCCGSSLFLKGTFGEGYHMKFVKESSSSDSGTPKQSDGSQAFPSLADPVIIQSYLRKFGPSPTLIDDTFHESHFTLLQWTGQQMRDLMKQLEDPNVIQHLHVVSYGLHDSTLEEVFLRVSRPQQQTLPKIEKKPRRKNKRKKRMPKVESGGESDDNGDFMSYATQRKRPVHDGAVPMPAATAGRVTKSASSSSLSEDDDGTKTLASGSSTRHPLYMPVCGGSLFWQQFYSILYKRLCYTRRNGRAVFSQIFLPILFVVVAMSVAFTVAMIEELPPIELSPAQYYNYTRPNGNVIAFTNVHSTKPCSDNETDQVCPRDLVDTLYLPAGVGATCLLANPNMTFDPSVMNSTMARNYTYLKKFFIPECERVFRTSAFSSRNFVPPTPEGKQLENVTIGIHQGMGEDKHYYPTCYCRMDGAGYWCYRNNQDPPELHLLTGDILYDITGQNASEYFLYTTDRYPLRRYGAMAFGHVLKEVPQNFGIGASTAFKRIAIGKVSKVWFDNTGYHAMPVYLNTLNNAILRAAMPARKGASSAYGITLINHPMEGTNTRLSSEKILEGTDVVIAMFIVAAMSFVPASFVLFLVSERHSKAKHIQFLAGMSPMAYWLGNFVYDIISYMVPAVCCCMIIRIFAVPSYVSDMNFAAVVALFVMYGVSITPMMYPATFYFNEATTAYISMIVSNLFVGITCIMTSFMLQLFGTVLEYFNRVHQVTQMFFMISPTFCLGRGLMDIAFNYYFNEYFILTGQYDQIRSPFYWDIINRNLVSMAIVGVLSLAVTLMLEYCRLGRCCRSDSIVDSGSFLESHFDEETDVAKERHRVLSGAASGDVVRVVNLSKTYKSRKLGDFLAVRQSCFGVPNGECFGLLGVNGAGKTTTFGMLTGDIRITSGDAFIADHSIVSEVRLAQSCIGYCPQFDCLFDELTAREHLTIFCLVRGIPKRTIPKVIDWALEKLDLVKYADKEAVTYSGGTKRKLSTAIALVGDPRVIMLDEPTTGMDPLSKRFLWDILISLTKAGKSVILTSHSMEECEALCTRLAIMVNGRFHCLGSIQHLKNTYGDGYSIRIRLKSSDNSKAVEQFMGVSLPDATLKESHHSYIHYEINSTIPLSRVFDVCERLSRAVSIESYSVSQNTLDNVFVNFAKHQGELEERVKRNSRTVSDDGVFPLDDAAVPVYSSTIAAERANLCI